MPPAIAVHNLSKRYRISHNLQLPGVRSLGDALARLRSSPLGWLGRPARSSDADFWALRDVTVEIRPGETVGLIGRNGAGKSTLLKIISLITRPTTGRLRVHGRVGSLLELGVGFHPELSGRENVFLSGAILGMRPREIAGKLDTIVGFAQVEKFFDTPIKWYSSGMLARLAFAVASHLETEILIVDEALSVGDQEFQARCTERMTRLAGEGRTVVFVSHSLGALSDLCTRGILLDQGRVVEDGPIRDVIATYTRLAATPPCPAADRPGKGRVRVARLEVCRGDGTPTAFLTVGQAGRFVCELSEVPPGLACELVFYNDAGQPVAVCHSSPAGSADRVDPAAGPRFICDVAALLFLPGRYRVAVTLLLGAERQDHYFGAADFELLPGELAGRPVTASPVGTVALPHHWTLPGAGHPAVDHTE